MPRRSRRGCPGHLLAELVRVAPAVDVICSAVADKYGPTPVSESADAGPIGSTPPEKRRPGKRSSGVNTAQVPAHYPSRRDQSKQ
jgi:hypothetical protein